MNDSLKVLLNRIPPILKNRYFLTLVVFLVWIMLFDNNNLIDRYHYLKNLRQLEKDKKYYQERIEEDRRKLNELKTSDENLEKFAREQYFMKKENEDIYIIVDEEGNKLPDPEDK
ncbi:MAG: FtsB family cell division protein [Bacteroidota bacterium]